MLRIALQAGGKGGKIHFMIESKPAFRDTLSVEDWQDLTREWEAFNRMLVGRLISLPPEKRLEVTVELVKSHTEGPVSVEERRYYTDLAGYPDETLGRIMEAIRRNEAKGVYLIRTSILSPQS